MPAQAASIRVCAARQQKSWIPAYAGMTDREQRVSLAYPGTAAEGPLVLPRYLLHQPHPFLDAVSLFIGG